MSQWRIETSADFDRSLRKLDKTVARRVVDYLEDLLTLEDPRQRGKGLTADLRGYWRYRVGDYRVVAKIEDTRMVIMAVVVGNRSGVFD